MRLAKDDKAGQVPKELYNHYTVILFDETTGKYSHVSNASFFKEEVSAIVAAFDRWIAGVHLQGCLPIQMSPIVHHASSIGVLSSYGSFYRRDTFYEGKLFSEESDLSSLAACFLKIRTRASQCLRVYCTSKILPEASILASGSRSE